MLPRITAVRHVHDYCLALTFSDGARGEIDLKDRIVGRGGVFAALEDTGAFASVRVDPEVGTLVWPNGVDMCPDVLYSQITGARLLGLETAVTAHSGPNLPGME